VKSEFAEPGPHPNPPPPAWEGPGGGERIAKLLARAGLCSRRDAERWIAQGRVSVDGNVLASPAVMVTSENDIRVDGKPIPQPDRARLWRYHKPAGLVTTHRDEKGRPTVFDALPKELPRLISIGRLDLLRPRRYREVRELRWGDRARVGAVAVWPIELMLLRRSVKNLPRPSPI